MFHVNPKTGNPGKCGASVRECPYGGSELHFETEAEAASFYEDSMLAKTFQRLKKTKEGVSFKLAKDYSFMMVRRSLREMKSDTMRGVLSIAGMIPKSVIEGAEKKGPAFGRALAGSGPAFGAAAKILGSKLAFLPFGALGASVAGTGIVIVGSGVALTVLGKNAFQDQKKLLLRPLPEPTPEQLQKPEESSFKEIYRKMQADKKAAEEAKATQTPLEAEADRLARTFSA